MKKISVAALLSFAFATTLHAQNVGAGAGTKTSRDAIDNTGNTPAATPPTDTKIPPPTAADANDARIKISGGFIHQFNTSVNSGGNYAADRAYGALYSRNKICDNTNLDIGVGYEFDHYQFNNTGFGLGSTLNTETLSITPRFTVRLDDHWAVGAAPLLQISGEAEASSGSTITGGGLANFRYAFDNDHVLGLGVLAKGLLGHGALVVPAPLVDWQISPGLRISNIRAPEANPFVGMELVQELEGEFNVGLGAGWQFRESRLDNTGSIPNGIFQESNTSLYARFEWHPLPALRFDFIAGSAVYSRVKTLDGGGNTLTSTGGNPALILGVFASYRF